MKILEILDMASNKIQNLLDPTSAQDAATKAYVDGLSPSGTIDMFSGLNAPAGYLLCNGSAVSRTTYAALFAVLAISTTGTTTTASNSITAIPSTTGMAIGMPISGPGIPAATTVASIVSGTAITISINATASASGVAIVVAPNGIGDGSTTFNLPDMRGRVPFGVDGTHALGSTGGALTHTHTLSDAGQAQLVIAVAASPAIHVRRVSTGAAWTSTQAGLTGGGSESASQGTNGTALTGATDSGSTVQPYLALNYIIKI